jgi:hypothetical protein
VHAPVVHTTPHPPQLLLSVEGSMHLPPHLMSPVGHTHVPETQLPRPHATPHPPQLSGSLDSSTHAPPHTSGVPDGQVHVPLLHDAPVAQ